MSAFVLKEWEITPMRLRVVSWNLPDLILVRHAVFVETSVLLVLRLFEYPEGPVVASPIMERQQLRASFRKSNRGYLAVVPVMPARGSPRQLANGRWLSIEIEANFGYRLAVRVAVNLFLNIRVEAFDCICTWLPDVDSVVHPLAVRCPADIELVDRGADGVSMI